MADRGVLPDSSGGLATLEGRHVLVAEDDYLLAGELRNWLAGKGAVVIGPVPRVEVALELIGRSSRMSLAILDINLQGRMVWPVADALTAWRIPFVLVTGYDAEVIPRAYAQAPHAEKPIDLGRLSRLLLSVLA